MVFVKPGTKFDDYNRRDELLMELLPVVGSIADEVYVFQHRTVLRLVARVKQWSCFVVKVRNSLLLACCRPRARTSDRG